MSFKVGDRVMVVSKKAEKDDLKVGQVFTVLEADPFPQGNDTFIRFSTDSQSGEWTMASYLTYATKLHKVLG